MSCDIKDFARSVLGVCVLQLLSMTGVGTHVIRGEEPAREFLERLVESRYYDVSLDYLTQLETSPLAPADLKEQILYDRGRILIKASSTIRDFSAREQQLDQAQKFLDEFIRTKSNHPRASAARAELANLLEQRGTIAVERSKSPAGQAHREQLLADARKHYDQAYTLYGKIEDELRETLKNIPATLKVGTPEYDRRRDLRAEFLQASLLAAIIREEMADTAPEGSPDQKQFLGEAAAKYKKIYESYRQLIAGLHARQYHGRVLLKMGNVPEALNDFVELLENPASNEQLRKLKTTTLVQAIQCWTSPGQKKYAEAIRRADEWFKESSPAEVRSEEWLKLRLQLAMAYQGFADYLAQEDPKDPQIRRSREEARQAARYVARYSADLAEAARRIEADLGGRQPEETTARAAPKSFQEAFDAANEALQTKQAQGVIVKDLESKLAEATDEAEKQQLNQRLLSAQSTINAARTEAIGYCQQAQELADAETPTDDLSSTRYLLSYLHFEQGDYFEAAALGEYVARRHPGSPVASHSANVALAAYQRLHLIQDNTDHQFEATHVAEMAEYIFQRWPQTAEGERALGLLIDLKVQHGDVQKAQEYLSSIPETAPARGLAELKTGRALWGSYLRGVAEMNQWETAGGPPDGVDAAARKAELGQLKTRAHQLLASGIDRMKGDAQVDGIQAAAALALAQVYVDTDQADKAIALLEDPQRGPLTLVRQQHPATATLVQDVYKTALRAYIGGLAATADPQALITKAQGAMQDLKTSAGTSEEAQKKLITQYVGLARDLKRQIELTGSPEAKRRLSAGFETFLTQVVEGSNELSVLNWAGETFAGMGEALTPAQGPLPADAKHYFQRAATAYDRILELGKTQPEVLEKNLKLQIQLRKAIAHRNGQEFEKAMELLESLLQENGSLVNVQMEAARTYQLWARFPGKEGLYARAILGGRPDKSNKNLVWGWGQAGKITARHPQFRDAFFECRYNLALCHYELGLAMQKKPDAKEAALNFDLAKRDITRTLSLFTVDEKWTGQFDQLMRSIQKAAGENVVGLTSTSTQPTALKQP